MCGLVGFIGKNEKSFFNPLKIKLLMSYNETRGTHSSGIYSPTNGLIKKAGKTTEKFLNEVVLKPDNLIICHTRQATGTAQTEENAHPFEKDELILAHNGTIRNIHEICQNEDDFTYDFHRVDSKYCLDLFVKYKDPKLVIPKMIGIANFLIYNKNTPLTMYIYKHKERTLFRGQSEEGMYISSIKESLEAIECTDIKEFADDYFYTVEAGKVKANLKVKMKEYQYANNMNGPSTKNLNWKLYKTNRVVKFKNVTALYTESDLNSSNKYQLFPGAFYLISTGLTSETDGTLKLYLDYDYNKETHQIPSGWVEWKHLEHNKDIEKLDVVECVFGHTGSNHLNDKDTEVLKEGDYFIVMGVKVPDSRTTTYGKVNTLVLFRMEDYKKYLDDKNHPLKFYESSESYFWCLDRDEEKTAYYSIDVETSGNQCFELASNLEEIEKVLDQQVDDLIDKGLESLKNKKNDTVPSNDSDLSQNALYQDYLGEKVGPSEDKILFDKDDIVTRKSYPGKYLVDRAYTQFDKDLNKTIKCINLQTGHTDWLKPDFVVLIEDEEITRDEPLSENKSDEQVAFLGIVKTFYALNEEIGRIDAISQRNILTTKLRILKDAICTYISTNEELKSTEEEIDKVFREELDEIEQERYGGVWD